MREWGVSLGGVYLSGGTDHSLPGACDELQPLGCLSSAPDGLGSPDLRTEDVQYPQRDGAKHFSDWYEPRIVTLADVTVCRSGCGHLAGGGPLAVRSSVAGIIDAWSRQCDDTELIIYTPWHHETGPRGLKGPYALIGRPRVASVQWLTHECAVLTLRFDAVDHRMYLTSGTCHLPGSGVECVEVLPGAPASACREYPRCHPGGQWCYDQPIAGGGTLPALYNDGTVPAYPTITLVGGLDQPRLTNVTTGGAITYGGTIRPGDPDVIIDTSTGSATQGGASRTHLLGGDIFLSLPPGDGSALQLTSYGFSADGRADVCIRPAVVSA